MPKYIAPELLTSFLKARPGLTQAVAAGQLNIVPAALNAYLKGKQRPRSDIRKRIERWSSGAVPEASWLTADEASELLDVSEAVVPLEEERASDAGEVPDGVPAAVSKV